MFSSLSFADFILHNTFNIFFKSETKTTINWNFVAACALAVYVRAADEQQHRSKPPFSFVNLSWPARKKQINHEAFNHLHLFFPMSSCASLLCIFGLLLYRPLQPVKDRYTARKYFLTRWLILFKNKIFISRFYMGWWKVYTLLRIRNPLSLFHFSCGSVSDVLRQCKPEFFSLMRIRIWILLLMKVMSISDHRRIDPPGLRFEPLLLIIHFEPSQLLNFDFDLVSDHAFDFSADLGLDSWFSLWSVSGSGFSKCCKSGIATTTSFLKRVWGRILKI